MSEDVALEAPLSAMERRTLILSKIEWAMLDVVRQLAAIQAGASTTTIIIKTSADPRDHQVVLTRRMGPKLAYNLKTLAQVYELVRSDTMATKRDLYYDQKLLYGSQDRLDRSITTVCQLLNETRIAINVLSCAKGLLRGAVAFMTGNGDVIDCRASSQLCVEQLCELRPISGAQFILVVEKEATFQKMLDDGFQGLYPRGILATGKGYPDICTRKVLRSLVERLDVPIMGLFDGDPYGMEILLTYKYGSMYERAEGRGAHIPTMQWIGFRPSEASHMPVAWDQHLALANRDYVKLSRVERRARQLNETELEGEVQLLRDRRTKLELEALSEAGQGFLTRVYLHPRIASALAPQPQAPQATPAPPPVAPPLQVMGPPRLPALKRKSLESEFSDEDDF